MPQAVKLTEETVSICATKTGESPADIRAMFELARERGYDSYIVFDYYGPQGNYVPWSQMHEAFFTQNFRFVFVPENALKFEAIVPL